MKDFNFFEPYLKKKDNIKGNSLYLYIALSLLCISLITYPIINIFRISRVNDEIAVMKTHGELDYLQEKNNNILEKEQSVEQLNTILNSLLELDNSIKDSDLINEHLIYTLSASVPQDVFLQSISIGEGTIDIGGIAKDKTTIGELQYNLRQLNTFKDIFIPNITNEGGLYSFRMAILIQDVINNETN